jgi:hypothetical protein
MMETGSGLYIRRFPILKEAGDLINSNVRDFGLNQGALETLRNLGIRLTVENLTHQTRAILLTEPCLVIGNHPTMTEPLVLPAALPQREDGFLLMSQSFLSFFPSVRPHIIPIYLGSRRKDEKATVSVLRRILTYGNIDYEEAHERNIESIRVASRRISDGESGIIFPAPHAPLQRGRWKPGIGYLVRGIEYPTETYIVEAFIEGATDLDVLRILPGFKYIPQDIRVTFSDPQKVSSIEDRNPKAMERNYLDWANSISRRNTGGR